MDLKKMLDEVENIDYSAVIARLAGQPLTEDQKEMCARYDALYDMTHGQIGGEHNGREV